jgi:hypothetical protein
MHHVHDTPKKIPHANPDLFRSVIAAAASPIPRIVTPLTANPYQPPRNQKDGGPEIRSAASFYPVLISQTTVN